MLKTVQAKVLAVLAALGFSAVVVTMSADGCTVKPVASTPVDAGLEDAGTP